MKSKCILCKHEEVLPQNEPCVTCMSGLGFERLRFEPIEELGTTEHPKADE